MWVCGWECGDGDGEPKGSYEGCEAGVAGGVCGDGGEVRAGGDAVDDEAGEWVGGEMGAGVLGNLEVGACLDELLGGALVLA